MITVSYPDGVFKGARYVGGFTHAGETVAYFDLRVRYNLPDGSFVDHWMKIEENQTTGELRDATPPSWRAETLEALRRAVGGLGDLGIYEA